MTHARLIDQSGPSIFADWPVLSGAAVGVGSLLPHLILPETLSVSFAAVLIGLIAAGIASLVFWSSLAISLVIAGIVAFPLNRWLIMRGRGHAIVHRYH